jgi:hypothetical protein
LKLIIIISIIIHQGELLSSHEHASAIEYVCKVAKHLNIETSIIMTELGEYLNKEGNLQSTEILACEFLLGEYIDRTLRKM